LNLWGQRGGRDRLFEGKSAPTIRSKATRIPQLESRKLKQKGATRRPPRSRDWLIVTQQWIDAIAVLVLAKLLGVGITAFIFEVTKDKLLQMAWLRRIYEFFIWLRAWAHQKVQPITRRLRKWRHVLRLYRSGRFIAQLMRFRRRMRFATASGT
jgi:hypothetical protein